MISAAIAVVITYLSVGPNGLLAGSVREWIAERPVRANWPRLIVAGIHEQQAPPRAVPLLEFTDYQCPFCRDAHGAVKQLLAEHPNVMLLYLPFPLAIHSRAREAALASLCAANQGSFEKLNAFLFETDDWFGPGQPNWDQIATAAAIENPGQLRTCMSRPMVAACLDSAVALGRSIGVGGTPTFVTRDGFVRGRITKAKLEAALHLVP